MDTAYTGIADSIILRTSKNHAKDTPSLNDHVLLYFIPGNPGLISYYRRFFSYLEPAFQPLTDKTGTTFTVAGHSLAGFHVNSTRTTASDGLTPLPLSLQQQVEDVECQISLTATRVAGSFIEVEPRPLRVILIGHSVGAYILMSILSRRARQYASAGPPPYYITAGINLFPTITDLHLSANGKKASWIAWIPGLSYFMQRLARLLTWLVSFTTLLALVKRVTRQPDQAAQVTTSFLSSPMGVHQSIYLAQYELLEMREDNWSDDVWTTTTASTSSSDREKTKLFFYYARDDHWIANSTRDALIANRVGTEHRPGPKMEIDFQHELKHDFCVREEQSKVVAEKVAGDIGEALGANQGSRSGVS